MDPPRLMLASRAFPCKSEALSAEAQVKRLTAAMKRELAGQWAAETVHE